MATYSDDFNRADSTNLGPNWTESFDDWSIVSNQLRPGSSGTSFVIYTSPLDTVDHYAEIVISTISSTSMGVFARANQFGNDFYLWRNSGTSWDMFVNLGGSFSTIGASYAAAAVDGDVARIECVGSTIKGYVNGIERVSVTDTNIASGTHLYAGVRSGASNIIRYDTFLASDIGLAPVDTGAFLDFM